MAGLQQKPDAILEKKILLGIHGIKIVISYTETFVLTTWPRFRLPFFFLSFNNILKYIIKYYYDNTRSDIMCAILHFMKSNEND